MGETLQCTLDHRYSLTVAFDGKTAQEGHRKIRLKVHSTDHDSEHLATKTFLWPETKLPSEVRYLNDQGIVEVIGENNIAKIALNMDNVLLARLEGMRVEAEPSPMYGSMLKDRTLLPDDPLTIAITNLINRKDVDRWWAKTEELLNAAGDWAMSPQLSLSLLAPWRQQRLLDYICDRMRADDSAVNILAALVKQPIFTSADAMKRIVGLAEKEDRMEIVFNLVRHALSIDEAVYAISVKLAVNRLDTDGKLLLETLLNQPITRNRLVEEIGKQLTGHEAAILMEHLLEMLDTQITDDHFYASVLGLLSVLVDGCAQKMVWDSECHAVIRKAAECITEQVQFADTISTFGFHLSEEAAKLQLDSEVINMDYVIETVPYQFQAL